MDPHPEPFTPAHAQQARRIDPREATQMVASSIRPGYTTGHSYPTVTKTTKTTVREFDADERCVKETITEETETTHGYTNPTWYYGTNYPLISNHGYTTYASQGDGVASTLHAAKRQADAQRAADKEGQRDA